MLEFNLSFPSRKQWFYFGVLMLTGIAFMTFTFTIALHLLIFTPSIFALSYSSGNLSIILAFVALKGLWKQLKHMLTGRRAIFSLFYVCSILATLYVSIFVRSYIASFVFCGIQTMALMFYSVTYFPGGIKGMRGTAKCVINIFIPFVKYKLR